MKWTVMMMVTIVVDYNINCNDYDGEVNDMIVVMIDLFTKCNAMPSAFNWIQIPQFLSSSSSPLLSKVFIVIVTIVIKNFHCPCHHCHNFLSSSSLLSSKNFFLMSPCRGFRKWHEILYHSGVWVNKARHSDKKSKNPKNPKSKK